MSAAAERARRFLARRGAWLEPAGDRYLVRAGPDRRLRPLQRLGETEFLALARAPGLVVRRGGGWVLRRRGDDAPVPPPGRPGLIEGERAVMEADGRLTRRRVNLGESPVMWLARRKAADGQPWLTAAEAAAGERLREDAELASLAPPVTQRWDGLPRRAGGTASPFAPALRTLRARDRVRAALDAAGPGLAEILERVCIHGSALRAVERQLGLEQRTGRALLKQALQRLAAHYRIG